MTKDLWKSAFKKAKKIDAEGEKDFAYVPRGATKKRDREEPVDDSSPTVYDEAKVTEEDDAEENSGFCQPVKLAKFVKDQTSGSNQSSTNAATEDAAVEQPEEETKERDFAEVCARQICRTWLKFAYLDNGNPCLDGTACLRKHAITCKPEHLYKDYSFKGLSPKQRKRIMDKLTAELSA